MLAIWLFGSAAPHHVRAQASDTAAETVEARQLFQAGVAHYEAARYAEALAQFEQAYRLKPHPIVLVNIANCYDKLKRPVEAADHFDAFLASAEGTPAQREEVQHALSQLSTQVGRLVLHVTPDTARVLLDERLPVRPTGQWVAPGRHRLELSADGYEEMVHVFNARPGEVSDVRVELVALAPSAPPAPVQPPAAVEAPETREPPAGLLAPETEPAPRQSGPRALSTSVWIAGGTTFVLGVTAAVTGQLALAANREFDTNLSAVRNSMLTEFQRAGAWARGVDAANRAEALAAATDILLVLTLAGAGLTAYFYATDPEPEESGTRVSVQAGPASGQVQVRGHF